MCTMLLMDVLEGTFVAVAISLFVMYLLERKKQAQFASLMAQSREEFTKDLASEEVHGPVR